MASKVLSWQNSQYFAGAGRSWQQINKNWSQAREGASVPAPGVCFRNPEAGVAVFY
jgi:hypothetical protein